MSGARFSTAVAARRSEPPDSLDYFPTPPWATRAFVQHVMIPELGAKPGDSVWEPACGEGHMAAVLAETFKATFASDVFDYGYGYVRDFLDREPGEVAPDWIVTNPPFIAGEAFTLQALAIAREGVALLVRLQWLEGEARSRLFSSHPPALVAVSAERIPMHRGRWEPAGSTATSYAWVCWFARRTNDRTRLIWIPPGQRKALTRPDDAARFGAKADAPLLAEGGR